MITIGFSDYFCTVTLDRPQKKNALTSEMYQQMNDAFSKASRSKKIKALIIRAQGDYFCSGHDINEFILKPKEINKKHPLIEFLTKLANFSKLLICVVDGNAIGIGATMLLHADFVIAQRRVEISMPFIQMGLCAEAGASQLLERVIGKAVAREMLLFGKTKRIEEFKGRLVNEITNSSLQSEALLKLIKKQIIELPLTGILKNKDLMRPRNETIDQTMQREILSFAQMLQSPGTKNILEKYFAQTKGK